MKKYLCNDANSAIEIEAVSPRAAAKAFVAAFEPAARTYWVTVAVTPVRWGRPVKSMRSKHKIAVDPPEPACAEDSAGHEWKDVSMRCHGAGVVYVDRCQRCGWYREVDTYAQDHDDGEQGLHSVAYGLQL